ncbi:MAG: lipocalin-like domain-containing protein [Candidatus Bathyarchaeota archaeon]|nr:lipocalin-like domain-containing protein [Candidatus Bathyarchaeota archaeon]
MSQKVIGVWKLVSCEFHHGDQVTYPWGHYPLGYLMYLRNGYMAVQLMAAERQRFASGDSLKGTFEEYADAGKTYAGYCGTYEVRENTVIHHVDVSSFPNWVGEQFVRYAKLDGDTLILSTPPMLFEGQPQTAHLVWQKVS